MWGRVFAGLGDTVFLIADLPVMTFSVSRNLKNCFKETMFLATLLGESFFFLRCSKKSAISRSLTEAGVRDPPFAEKSHKGGYVP